MMVMWRFGVAAIEMAPAARSGSVKMNGSVHTAPHRVQLMDTVWGEFAAPEAVIVTLPLTEMLLTVTVCRCPLSSEPLCGDIL